MNLAIQTSAPGNAILFALANRPLRLGPGIQLRSPPIPAEWSAVGQPVVITNAQNTVTVSASGAPQYYRLHQIIP